MSALRETNRVEGYMAIAKENLELGGRRAHSERKSSI